MRNGKVLYIEDRYLPNWITVKNLLFLFLDAIGLVLRQKLIPFQTPRSSSMAPKVCPTSAAGTLVTSCGSHSGTSLPAGGLSSGFWLLGLQMMWLKLFLNASWNWCNH